MAIIFKGNKLANLMYKGKKIEGLYYKGKKIYGLHLSPGAVVSDFKDKGISSSSEFNRGANPHIVINGKIPLTVPLKKIKNGITIKTPATTKVISMASPIVQVDATHPQTTPFILETQYDSKIPASFNIKMADLLTQKYVTFWNPTVSFGNGDTRTLQVKYSVSQNTLYFNAFYMFDGKEIDVNNSTLFFHTSDTPSERARSLILLIDSVTAY